METISFNVGTYNGLLLDSGGYVIVLKYLQFMIIFFRDLQTRIHQHNVYYVEVFTGFVHFT